MGRGYQYCCIFETHRGPSTPLGCGILEKAWIGKKINYSFLKTFSCEAFSHIDSKNKIKVEAKSKKCAFFWYYISKFGYRLWDFENRTKLKAKSKKCVFIGYGINEFSYRLWDFGKYKIIRSRDVIFNEKVLYKDLLQQHEKKEDDYVMLDDTPKVDVPTIHHDLQQPQKWIPYTPVNVR